MNFGRVGKRFGGRRSFRRGRRSFKSGRRFKRSAMKVHRMNRVPRGGFRI